MWKRKERKEGKYSERLNWVRSFCTLFALRTGRSTRIFVVQHATCEKYTHTHAHTNTGSEAGTHNLSVECVILYFRRSKFSYDNVGSTRRQGRIFFSSALPDCPQSSFSPSFCSSVRCCFSCKSAATTTSLPLTSTSTHTIPAIIFISKKIKHKTETAHFTISSSLTATNTSLSLSVCVFVCVFIALCILS